MGNSVKRQTSANKAWKEVKHLWPDYAGFEVWYRKQENKFQDFKMLSLITIDKKDSRDSWRLVPRSLKYCLQGTSGNVYPYHSGGWQALLLFQGQRRWLGVYPSREEALIAYWQEKIASFKRTYRGLLDCRLFLHCLDTLDRRMERDLGE